MAYIFIDDGYPDSRDYDNNYLYYDPDDIDQMEQILQLLEQRLKKRNLQNTASVRVLLNAIEKQRGHSIQKRERETNREISIAKRAQGIVERCFQAVSATCSH